MFGEYVPKKFCREYVDLKNSSRQLVMFMATVAGAKRAMDDWIPKKNYPALQKVCKKYGVLLKPDAAFSRIDDPALKKSVGNETLTTTIAAGKPLEKTGPDDMIHVFLARKKDDLESIFGNGWYPVIVKDRVIQKPYIDLLKFGYDLGYPECCVKFFRHFNDWSRFSNLFETYRHTKGEPNFLCNCFTKDVVYSYIYHIPCSFDCVQTAKTAGRVRAAIEAEEPEFVRLIDQHLRAPFLIFYETTMYAFEGEIRNKKLFYSAVYFIGRGGAKGQDLHYPVLARGDNLFIEGKDVIVMKGKKVAGRIRHGKENLLHIPFLIQFK